MTYVLIGALAAAQQFAAVHDAIQDCTHSWIDRTFVEAFDPMFRTTAAITWPTGQNESLQNSEREFQVGAVFSSSANGVGQFHQFDAKTYSLGVDDNRVVNVGRLHCKDKRLADIVIVFN